MPSVLQIRDETPSDRQGVRTLVAGAFGRWQEAELVDDLRTAGDLAVSLVAEKESRLCGYVAMSRLKSPDRALALAPVAVSPRDQDSGIGAALVREALRCAREHEAAIVFVVGEPDYYSRFGFSAEAAAPFPCPYAGRHFMAAWLSDPHTRCEPVVYPDAFAKLD